MDENPHEPPKEVNDPKGSRIVGLLLLIGAVPAALVCFFVTCIGSEAGAIAIGIPYPGAIPLVIGAVCGFATWLYVRHHATRT
jgi:hypothetical protein